MIRHKRTGELKADAEARKALNLKGKKDVKPTDVRRDTCWVLSDGVACAVS